MLFSSPYLFFPLTVADDCCNEMSVYSEIYNGTEFGVYVKDTYKHNGRPFYYNLHGDTNLYWDGFRRMWIVSILAT